MSNDTQHTIRISGMDYSNRCRSLLPRIMKQDAENKDLFYPYPGVTFNVEDLFSDTEEDRSILGKIGANSAGEYFFHRDNMVICFKSKNFSAIRKRFEKADVLIFSGHHYGADYYKDENHNFYAPGLTSRKEMRHPTPTCPFSFAPAFDLNLLYYADAGAPFKNVKLIILLGCNGLRENALHLYQELFPNALVLAYHYKAPSGTHDDKWLKSFILNLPWKKQSLCKGLLADNVTKKDFQQMIIGAWKKGISASESSRHYQPGYFCEMDGVWKGSYVNSSLTKKKGSLQFNKLGDPTYTPSKIIRLLDYDMEEAVVKCMKAKEKKDFDYKTDPDCKDFRDLEVFFNTDETIPDKKEDTTTETPNE